MSGKNPFLGLGFGNPFITFIRNSIASALILNLDAGNRESFSPNVFPRGKDIYGWYVDTNGDADGWQVLLSRDTITSPVGNTPLKMEITGNDPYLESYIGSEWNLANTASGDTWTISVYAKASQSTTGELYLFGADLNSQYVEAPYGTVNITTSWTRVSFTTTFANANTKFLQMRLDGTQSGGSGITIWWDGLQIERGSTVTEFTEEYTVDSNTLDERILDLSGNGNNATLTNGPTFNSANGGSIVFDGVDDYASLPSSIGINGNEITVSIWNYGIASQTSSVIRCDTSSGNRVLNIHLPWSSNTVYFDKGGGADSYDRIYKFVTDSEYQGWHHWSFTANVTTGSMKIYLDGALWHSGTGLTRAIGIPDGTCAISLYSGDSQGYHNGYISQFLIYTRELSAAEVAQNYNALKGRYS